MYYVTGRCRIKAVPNDQCGSVRKVLSVRRRWPRFARPPGAFGPTPADSLRSSADRGSSRSAFGRDTDFGRDLLTYLRTQSNLRTSLRSYVTDRSGSKQYRTISAVRFGKSFRSDAGGLASLGRRSGSVRRRLANGRDGRDLLTYAQNLICRPHSVPS